MDGRTEVQIVDSETDEVVHRIDVTGRTESQIDRVERGVLINLDRDRFFVQVGT